MHKTFIKTYSVFLSIQGIALWLVIVLCSPAVDSKEIAIVIEGQANGTVVIDLLDDVAPKHAARIVALAHSGAYDGVAFHRVIDGFMAQTGDVAFGKIDAMGRYDPAAAGRGGSELPDLPAEFSNIPFDRGIVGMARAANPNSANSQFFIMFDAGYFLNGQYTVVGRVTEGMQIVDRIKRGTGPNGVVLSDPDMIKSARVVE